MVNAPASHAGDRKPLFGMFVPEAPRQGVEAVLQREAQLGHALGVVHWFQDWNAADDWSGVPRVDWIEEVARTGRRPVISWELSGGAGWDPAYRLDTVVSGAHDPYVRTWARALADYGSPVWIRLMPEMNGDWTPWNGTVNGQDPGQFVAAWRRVVDLFRSEGADNVRWVWSPNETDEPRVAGNALERYWPGSSYVDVLGIDGYDWGVGGPGGSRSFAEIFEEPYRRVTALSPTAPVWIAEVATAPGDKAAWVADMLAAIERAFPRVEAVVWFDIDKERDWRLDAPAVRVISDWLSGGAAFTDITGSVHRPAIERILEAGITAGCTPGRFCPEAPVTRAQMATFLTRALRLPSGEPSDFADVRPGDQHAAAIGALAAAGITGGCGPRRFCPEQPVSRGQMASFLARAFDLPPGEQTFTDVGGSAHEPGIGAVAAGRITSGCSLERFCPSQAVTRAQMASFLARTLWPQA